MEAFTRRAGEPRTLEDRNILAMMMQNKSGEITLKLTDEQYDKLRESMTRKIKQYKPIKFGDGPDLTQ